MDLDKKIYASSGFILVDGVRNDILTSLDLLTCQGISPAKKSQLDLRLFGVGVLVVGRTVSPWLQLQAKVSKMSLLVERVLHAQQAN